MAWLGYGPAGLVLRTRRGTVSGGGAPPPAFPVATGGTVSDIIDPVDGLAYRVHVFTGSGTFDLAVGGEVDYLILGGGGSGANAPRGGGGGAGGTARTGSVALAAGTYPITIGTGAPGVGATIADGQSGSASSALGVSAPGGAGGTFNRSTGGPGGDGGSNADHPGGLGNPGNGNTAGGGAGAANPGFDWDQPASPGGTGGDGLLSGITGAAQYYGGGGGSAWRWAGPRPAGLGGATDGATGAPSLDAVANSGGGSGGTNNTPTGNGGSGIAIIRYRRAA